MVRPAFDAIGLKTAWLGETGQGSRMKLAVNAYLSILIGALAVEAGHGRHDISAARLALSSQR